uniref:J domain-containing protein n=1 Tax=Panagrolaimus davidi TaxID=227884 RepID=A0A914Q8X0_9BILA
MLSKISQIFGRLNFSRFAAGNLLNYSSFSATQKYIRHCSTISKFVCWKCGNDTVRKPEIICSSCKIIQPIHHGLSYFDYFNVKRDFVINQNELKKKFREIQTAVHPDKYGLHDEKVQKMADDHSSFANHAYKTLSDTRQRALYMLENSDVGENSPDPELAMQMMELNEEIEECNDRDELKEKLKEIEEHINDIN